MGVASDGVLIAESLRDQEVLKELNIVGTKVAQVANVVDNQPSQWTMHYFTVSRWRADLTAAHLSHSLQDGHWYINYTVGNIVYVVFSQRIFKYPKGDHIRRLQAVWHGRTLGIPDEQLDWEE